MKHLLAYFSRASRPEPRSGFDMLPESVAYSALLASGVEGAGDVSFAQFVSVIHGQRTRHHQPTPYGGKQ